MIMAESYGAFCLLDRISGTRDLKALMRHEFTFDCFFVNIAKIRGLNRWCSVVVLNNAYLNLHQAFQSESGFQGTNR